MRNSSSTAPIAASTAAIPPQPIKPSAAPEAPTPRVGAAGPRPQSQAPDTDPGALEYLSWLRQLQAAQP